ncbi:hypothetical protein [Streptomyces sp. NBC_01207]|uniref:hypothetical protein n=1 Tax=Streptomyces sp. NBC_01207 TaxID=2903772 RepID=UPI002E10A201|nr:hypothetical protein OG457_27625 [Streptomyces sp. NBC_01207]
MTKQRSVPELTDGEWQTWFRAPDGVMPCPVKWCGEESAAYWNGRDEVVSWDGCGHRAFVPESPSPWPPPDSHVRRSPSTGDR